MYFDDFFNELINGQVPSKQSEAARCIFCGSTLENISQTGRVGCAECYQTFSRELNPYIRRLHGQAQHQGRVPKSAGPAISKRRELEDLKKRLAAAIEKQEFERAAELRDTIKRLEGVM